jgi:hypothetical protein
MLGAADPGGHPLRSRSEADTCPGADMNASSGHPDSSGDYKSDNARIRRGHIQLPPPLPGEPQNSDGCSRPATEK